MKRFVVAFLLALPWSSLAQDLPKSEFTISAGYLLEGELYLWETDQYGSVGETFLLKSDFVGYFSDNFGMGGFVSYGVPYYDGYGEISMLTFGIAMKGRFKASDLVLIKPAGYLGFRTYGDTAGNGFGVDVSVAIQYQLEKVKPFLEFGILGQPAGGNDVTSITFSPIFQVSLGIGF